MIVLQLELTIRIPPGLWESFFKIDVNFFGGLIYYYYISVLLNLILKIMKDMSFEFTVDNGGEIEDIELYSETMEIDCRSVMKRILESKKLGLGERSEGMCEVEKDVVKLHYRVFSELGEEYVDHKWEELKEEFPIGELV